jgi:DNA-binding YbaB/EbfC family protein
VVAVRPRLPEGEKASEGLRQHHEGSAELQAQMAAMQEEVAKKKVDATAGGGMVTVEANGKQELTAIKIDPEVVNKGDVQMLEDLVLAAAKRGAQKIARACAAGSSAS